jgi:hypothetical protein
MPHQQRNHHRLHLHHQLPHQPLTPIQRWVVDPRQAGHPTLETPPIPRLRAVGLNAAGGCADRSASFGPSSGQPETMCDAWRNAGALFGVAPVKHGGFL